MDVEQQRYTIMKQKYDKQVMQKAYEVFHVMSKRVSGKDMERIREAFEFAYEAHADQKRKSGEPLYHV